jgi:outer membrane lipoprotein SlyB
LWHGSIGANYGTLKAGSGAGAVAGIVVGGVLVDQIGGGNGSNTMTAAGTGPGTFAGHGIEQNMKRRAIYEIGVRIDSSIRTFHSDSPEVGAGRRVKLRGGSRVVTG